MIRDLVVPITNTEGDANALGTAIALAGRESAHLTVLQIFNLPMPTPSPWGLLPDMAMSEIYTTLRDKAERDAIAWRDRLATEAISSEVCVTESLFVEPPRTAALHARHSDVIVVTAGGNDKDEQSVVHGFFAALLLETGRPVLVVPPRFRSLDPARHVVVAWRASREAARALHDAMPMLRSAGSVDVVMVEPQGSASRKGPQPGAEIATHLARHGLKVSVVVHERETESIAMALTEHARKSGAELIVAGGYGHSRFREWALGGVTRKLLQTSPVPILFSH